MKAWLSMLILAITLQGGCRKATFQNIQDSSTQQTEDSVPNGADGLGETEDLGGNGDDHDGEVQKVPKTLVVSVPVAELPFGKTTTATAKLKDGTKEPVTWKIKAPLGKDGGTITDSGVVTPPKTGTEPVEIEVIAVLKSDPSVTGKVRLKLIPISSKPELIVTVPVPEIKIGSNKTTAVANIKNGMENPPVKWTIMGPGMRDLGKIDEKTGVYTSPATGGESFVVLIVATLIADPTVTGSTNLTVVPVNPMNAELIVTIPSPEIRAGGEEMPATARLKDGTLNPPVKWTIIGPPNVSDIGSISDKGIYKSPEKAANNIPVQIVATLIANPMVKASVSVMVLKVDQIFARCTRANTVFPIVADVYKLPANSMFLPADWKAQVFQTTVCLDQYNVPEREFTQGFPDLPNLFEDFGMTTRTSLIVPKDGLYKIRLTSDDGAKLYIDGQLRIDNDGAHQTKHRDEFIELKAGKHPIVLDYFQGPRFKIALVLLWQKPGDTELTVVPREAFE